MKNTEKDFAKPLLLGVIVLLTVILAIGIYVYKNKNVTTSLTNIEKKQSNESQQQANTQTQKDSSQQNISNNSKSNISTLKVNLNEEFNLDLGQIAEINNQNIGVKFNKVYPAGGGTGPMIFHYEPLFTFIINNQSYDQSQTKYRIKSVNDSLNENTKTIHLSVMTIESYCKNETGPDTEIEYSCFRNAARALGDSSYCNLITDAKRISQCKDAVKDYVKQ